MILKCPNCATRFLVDPAVLGPAGRTVRCGACGREWRQEPERPAERSFAAPATAEAPEETSEETRESTDGRRSEAPPARRLPAARRRPRQPRALFSLVLLAAIAVVLLGCYQFRSIIVAYWPDTAPFYDVLDIDAKPHPSIRPATANR